MTIKKEETAAVVVLDQQNIFGSEEQDTANHYLTQLTHRAMAICAPEEQKLSRQEQIQQIELLALEIQEFRKSYTIALGCLLDHVERTRLWEDADYPDFPSWCTSQLGIYESDRKQSLALFRAGSWMQQIGYTTKEITSTEMTPIKATAILDVKKSVIRQAVQLREQYRSKPEQLEQVLQEEMEEVIAQVKTILQQGDQEILRAKERQIGNLEKFNGVFMDIEFRHGNIEGILCIPATKEAAEMLNRALRSMFNLVCRTRKNPRTTFPLKDLAETLFSEEEEF